MRIGKAIEHFRRLAGMTQTDLAERIGMDQGNLSRLISGRQDVPLSRLEVISRVLGISVSQLVSYAEGDDDGLTRWTGIYAGMSQEEREAAMRLLEPQGSYQVSRKG